VAPQRRSARTFVVPYSAGTGPEILLASIVGEELQQRWRQPVVIENKPGASGKRRYTIRRTGGTDGHTLLMVSNPFAANINLFKNVPYDPVKSFAAIIEIAAGFLVLAVQPSIPAHSVKSSSST